MSQLEIRTIKTKKEIKAFIRFADHLYADDPLYVPVIKNDMYKKFVSEFIKGKAMYPAIAYNVYQDERMVARLYLNTYMARPGTPLEAKEGVFNYFEGIDDQHVFNTLFDQAKTWFIEQGVPTYYGNTNPLDPDDNRGILIEGFEDAPVSLCIYNKPYYQKLFETYGFKTREDLLGLKLVPEKVFDDAYESRVKRVKERYGYHVDDVNKHRIPEEAKDVIEIIQQSITDEWDMRGPETVEELSDFFNAWKHLLNFDYIKVARTDDGHKPIGFTMIIPNFNEVIQKLKGNLSWYNIPRALYYKKKIRTARAMIQMVIPEYQGKGVINALYYEYFELAKRDQLKYLDASTIGTTNTKSWVSIEKLGGYKYKLFRLYEYPLTKDDVYEA